MNEFRIGEAALRSGVPASTIRTWERRYGALGTPRSGTGQHRRYTQLQVERLRLLKRGIEEGDAIRTLARMTDDELRHRFSDPSAVPASSFDGTIRVGVSHGALAAALRREANGLQVATIAPAQWGQGNWDALILGSEQLDADGSEVLSGAVVFLTYHFASSREVLEWEASGWVPVRLPVSARRLDRLIRQELADRLHPRSPLPPRFSTEVLQKLQTIDSSIDCECPNHLAMILESVTAFERYCARCEIKAPEDGVLHKRLGREMAAVRVGVERMLERVILHDGIDLEDLAPQNAVESGG